MIIIGEVSDCFAQICFLERKSQTWAYDEKQIFVPAYTPTFLLLSLNEKNIFIFTSGNEKRSCKIPKKYQTCYVVACNNRHIIKDCSIWNKLREQPVDVIFGCGDQIYADRIFWRWFYEFEKVCDYETYKQDIELDYYREYLDTWEPLQDIFSTTSHIFIPDDHEARSRADLWSEKIVNQMPETLQSYIKDPKKKKFRKQKEKFIFETAFDLCKKLYLGLRITNTGKFDYIRNFDNYTVIMTERITQPLFGDDFIEMCKAHEMKKNVLLISGLPPMPIRENFVEFMFYRHPQNVPDEVYDRCFKLFKGCNVIAIGGDIHLGCAGDIYVEGEKLGTFHTTGPSSGFTSSYIPKDSLGSTSKTKFDVLEFNNRDANAVFVDLDIFTSSSIYSPSYYAASLYNLASTAYCFWT